MTARTRALLASRMLSVLPKFGHWGTSFRDFDTPYGRLGSRQLGILWILRHEMLLQGDISPTKLAGHFNVQPSVITGALAKLEASGFVNRTVDPQDSRVSRLTITDKGRHVSEYVEELLINEILDGLADVDDEQIQEICRSIEVLDKLVDELITKHTKRSPRRTHGKRDKPRIANEPPNSSTSVTKSASGSGVQPE